MQNTPFDFQSAVLDQSRNVPVLVDFWAPWCAPCRMLAPVLERLEEQARGRWQLVKVNTEEHPDIAGTYAVRSIPCVKLFVDGNVVDEFTGALPEHQIGQWLARAIPGPMVAIVTEAAAAAAGGDETRALVLFEEVLSNEPGNLPAVAGLVRLVLFSDPQRARKLAEQVEGDPEQADLCEAVRTLAPLLERPGAALPQGARREAYALAIECLRKRDYDGALEQFIGVLRQERSYDGDGSRKACIAIFRLLGEEHQTTMKYRRAFDRAF